MKTIQIEPTTSKQDEILLLLYRFRFLNRIQIQQFLNHKSDTRVTHWLKDLTERNIIKRIYSQTVGDINKPAIYYLGLKSRHILLLKFKEQCNAKLLHRVYREGKSSPTFQEHWIFMTDLYFHFLKVAKKNNAELHFYTQTDLENFAYLPLSLPDAYIAVKDQKQSKRYFLELIDGNEKWFEADKKMKRLISYFKKGYWQSHVDYPFPKIFIICPHRKLTKHLQEVIKKEFRKEEADIQFFFGIQADIQERGIQTNTWESVL